MSYTDSLPHGISLQVFNHDDLIFESSGKWLHPLFDFEDFLKNYEGSTDDLRSHDTAIGKAAALLSFHCGIRQINAELLSEKALNFAKNHNITVKYTSLIPKLMCATEELLDSFGEADEDLNQMYVLLRQRAKKVQGVKVEVKDLTHRFGFINKLSFTLEKGDRLLITGENGSGKSTLLKLLSGIEKPVSGSVLIDEKPVSKLEKNTIGYIPQFSETKKFSLNVKEVLSSVIPFTQKNASSVIKKNLERCNCLNLINHSFSSLSGGEKQKVLLARCLCQNAKLLLLDEPTASLDKENRQMVLDTLRSLSISEIPTIIVVTHDPELEKLPGWKKIKLGGN